MSTNLKFCNLSKDEIERLDKLLSSARSFHYSAFILSGLSLILSSLEKIPDIKIPLGDLILPPLQASVSIYILVLILILAAERLFNIAYPYIKIDKRRPPFAWIALSSKEPSFLSVTLWLLLPVLICAISTANSLNTKDITGYFLSFAGIMVILFPRSINEEYNLIRKRLDHRGGPATFSIWLLYHYRMIRSIIVTAFFFVPVLAVIPKWRDNLLSIIKSIIFIMVILIVLRIISHIPLCYRFIDRIGSKIGFPLYSKNYK